MRNEYRILIGKPERAIPILGPRNRWEDIDEMDQKKDMRVKNGFIWYSKGISDGFLRTE
jgi:hypothetical protein